MDTNILIYSVVAAAGERHEQAMALLDQIPERA